MFTLHYGCCEQEPTSILHNHYTGTVKEATLRLSARTWIPTTTEPYLDNGLPLLDHANVSASISTPRARTEIPANSVHFVSLNARSRQPARPRQAPPAGHIFCRSRQSPSVDKRAVRNSSFCCPSDHPNIGVQRHGQSGSVNASAGRFTSRQGRMSKGK